MSPVITVNTTPLDWVEGLTISEVLEKRRYTFKMLIVKINGELIKKEFWPSYEIPENAEVNVIHLMSGG